MLRSNIAVTAANGVIEFIGSCPAMTRVFHLIRKVANTDIPVLITGVTGTGKGMVAEAIHQRSARAQRPFVVVDCATIPRELLESELFGHEKGAFTGAFRSVAGKVELARGGTLFLDEVGELLLEMQVKLLRFLQDFTFERVGGRQCKEVNVRIIAATNCDLNEALVKKRFREDLYYRLNGINIKLPSLKERGDDVIILAEAFLRCFVNEYGKKIRGFSPEAVNALRLYSWPGNVRELIFCLRRAVVLAEGPWINPKDLEFVDKAGILLEPQNSNSLGLREAVNRFEAKLVGETLHKCRGDIKQAAEALKTSRSVIYHLIKKHGFKNDKGVHVQ